MNDIKPIVVDRLNRRIKELEGDVSLLRLCRADRLQKIKKLTEENENMNNIICDEVDGYSEYIKLKEENEGLMKIVGELATTGSIGLVELIYKARAIVSSQPEA